MACTGKWPWRSAADKVVKGTCSGVKEDAQSPQPSLCQEDTVPDEQVFVSMCQLKVVMPFFIDIDPKSKFGKRTRCLMRWDDMWERLRNARCSPHDRANFEE